MEHIWAHVASETKLFLYRIEALFTLRHGILARAAEQQVPDSHLHNNNFRRLSFLSTPTIFHM